MCWLNLGNIVMICRHRAAMPCDVCPSLPVWTSSLNVSASVVPIPSMIIPPREFFPIHLVSRHDVTPVVTELLRPLVFIFRDGIRPLQRTRSVVVRRSLISAGGRKPARYCASNARKAAVTVDPMPTIPSSTLGPSSAIQSSPRTNNLGLAHG